MTSWDHWPIAGLVVVLGLAITVGVVCPALAGPYVGRTIEYSNATSTRECGQQAVGVLSKLQKEGRFSRHDGEFASNKNSTVSIECVFVGRSEQRAQQWVFYIVVASEDAREGDDLKQLLRNRVRRIARFD